MEAKAIKVRTTPEEIAEFAKIKAAICIYKNLYAAASEKLKLAYKAENRPMVGGLNDSEFWIPKSEAIKKADKEFARISNICRAFGKTIGAKRLNRLHRLELAGVV